MMPDRQVSTTVGVLPCTLKNAIDRSCHDENLGRWILVGVVVLAIAAGVWYWQSRGKEAGAPAPPPAPASRGPGQEPIVAPDDIDPNLSATEQVATLDRHAALRVDVRARRVREEVVATVDSLARQDVAARMNPAKPPAASSQPAGEGDALVLGAANFARYAAWIETGRLAGRRSRRSRSTSASTRSSRRPTRISAIPTAISTTA
jgi:hypothetical protein